MNFIGEEVRLPLVVSSWTNWRRCRRNSKSFAEKGEASNSSRRCSSTHASAGFRSRAWICTYTGHVITRLRDSDLTLQTCQTQVTSCKSGRQPGRQVWQNLWRRISHALQHGVHCSEWRLQFLAIRELSLPQKSLAHREAALLK